MAVTTKATEVTILTTRVAKKKCAMTSNEDLTATAESSVPHTVDSTAGYPTLKTQIPTRCSSDAIVFCRSHSSKKCTTSKVPFAIKKKGINKVVGKKVM